MLREFKDSQGTPWQVWDINPSPRPSNPGRRLLAPVAGWLCFECGRERRRLSPVPRDWTTLSDAELEKLCKAAVVVPRAPIDRTPGPT